MSICACSCEPDDDDQPAAYYPSKTCWLFLVSVYTFGKTRDTFWHIHLMFYPVVKKIVSWVEERNPTLIGVLAFALLNPTYI
ncbi:hypothetical protein [Nostoc commune]|uniref:hypothetical protein n=1 Tax=Nostoc commune TaxID=1178 RepID=UPI0015E7F466|nr:hypothetical protein [Nostoc commune]